MPMIARNAETGHVIASDIEVATTHAARTIGLMGRRALRVDAGLWILPCRGVHTCFMRFPIDLIALDADGVVVDLVSGLRPWRMRLPRSRTSGVLEVAAGALERSGTRLGHRVVFDTGVPAGRETSDFPVKERV